MGRVYKRHCDYCGNFYEGWGARFCSPTCGDTSRRKPDLPPQMPADALPGADWPMPVRPVRIEVHALEREPSPDAPFTSVHYSDVHFPFHSDEALQILYAVTQDVAPGLIVDHGDTLDCYQISKYEKNPAHRVSLQDEIELAAAHFGRLTAIAPDARKLWLIGNHEDRLRRILWDMARDLPARQVLNLPGLTEALRWENLLGLRDMGWEVSDERVVLYDKLIAKHGNFVRKWSGYSARAEYERYGKSGMSGHTHRRGVFEHRDYNGFHAWWELGCMCDLDPDYTTDPDWQNGFAVVTWNEDRTLFSVEEVRIHDGQAMFRGKQYGDALFKSAMRAA